MAWTPTHAATRYFRQRGTVNNGNKLVVLVQTEKINNTVYQKHYRVLEAKGFHFSDNLFINN